MVSDFFVFKKKQELQATCSLSAEVDVGNLSAFLTEYKVTNREWSKIIYNQTLQETLRQNRLTFSLTNILTFSSATKTETSLTRFTSIKLVKQEDFCGAIALTYFAENCLD